MHITLCKDRFRTLEMSQLLCHTATDLHSSFVILGNALALRSNAAAVESATPCACQLVAFNSILPPPAFGPGAACAGTRQLCNRPLDT